MPHGRKPAHIATRILRNLAEYIEKLGRGEVYSDGIGYVVAELASRRQSFCPDVSYHDGPLPADPMRFIEGAPAFAVEVRSESDYRHGADEALAAKRADYFAAGTRVVWDVDTLNECIHAHRASDRGAPLTYRRGERADAEPAVPGWQVATDWIFA